MSIRATHKAVLDLLDAFGIASERAERVVITADVREVTRVDVTYLAVDAEAGHVQRSYEVVAREKPEAA